MITLESENHSDSDYAQTMISHVGFIDPYAVEGHLILKTPNDREFEMKSFPGETSRCISNFMKNSDELPTVYHLIEEICEQNEIILESVKIYESGNSLRANLYFTGKKELVMRNYRASDAIALAAFYKIPIYLRQNLLSDPVQN